MSSEHKERALRRSKERDQVQKDNTLSPEWLLLSKLGYYYGWSAVQDFQNDVITIPQARAFVLGAEKIHASHVYDATISSIAAKTTKETSFKKLLKPYLDDMKGV